MLACDEASAAESDDELRVNEVCGMLCPRNSPTAMRDWIGMDKANAFVSCESAEVACVETRLLIAVPANGSGGAYDFTS